MLTQISENVNSFRHPAIAKRSADTQLRTDPSVRYAADGIVTDKGRSLLFSDRSLNEQEQDLIRALRQSAVQCYAVEGFYPKSPEYLEE